MSNFNIDDEIDKDVDKLAAQLKTRLKKLVIRSEKLILKQYIASQKETSRLAKIKTVGGCNTGSGSKVAATKKAPPRKSPKKEADYGSSSEESFSDSDRD